MSGVPSAAVTRRLRPESRSCLLPENLVGRFVVTQTFESGVSQHAVGGDFAEVDLGDQNGFDEDRFAWGRQGAVGRGAKGRGLAPQRRQLLVQEVEPVAVEAGADPAAVVEVAG